MDLTTGNNKGTGWLKVPNKLFLFARKMDSKAQWGQEHSEK